MPISQAAWRKHLQDDGGALRSALIQRKPLKMTTNKYIQLQSRWPPHVLCTFAIPQCFAALRLTSTPSS